MFSFRVDLWTLIAISRAKSGLFGASEGVKTTEKEREVTVTYLILCKACKNAQKRFQVNIF